MKFDRCAAAFALLALLSACGGGGGGDAATAPHSEPLGLVPPAPALGATLRADAATLRPLHAGAVWRYRGTQVRRSGGVPISYETQTTQTVAAGSQTGDEASTNGANGGPETVAVTVVPGGTVSSRSSIDFAGKGVPEIVNLIELRSPVRQGDQYTTLQKRYTDTNIDVDRDGRPDTLDVAVYSSVIGTERLTLQDVPALQAVRVDTTLRLRVTPSGSGVALAPVDSTIQTWYAPGIGIVRQRSTQPYGLDGDALILDEGLRAYDGGSSGFGAMPTIDATVPSGPLAGKTLSDSSFGLRVYAFADHALVFSDVRGESVRAASTVDRRGRITASKVLENVPRGWRFAQLNDGLVQLDSFPSDATRPTLTRFSADGSVIGRMTLDLRGNRLVPSIDSLADLAGDGDRFWLLVRRSYRDTDPMFSIRREVVLRAYAPDGTPATDEILLPGEALGRLRVSRGRVMLTWAGPAPDRAPHVALVDRGTGQLGPVTMLPRLNGLEMDLATPIWLDDGAALVWRDGSYNAPSSLTAALRLDPGLRPLLPGPEPGAAQIAGLPAFEVAPVTAGSRIVFATLGPVEPSVSQQPAQVSWLDAGPVTALAATALHAVRFTPTLSSKPLAQAVFADRVLVFTDMYSLRTTLVWLNNGSTP